MVAVTKHQLNIVTYVFLHQHVRASELASHMSGWFRLPTLYGYSFTSIDNIGVDSKHDAIVANVIP